MYFKAAVSNNNSGNVTTVYWKQLEPDADVSSYTNIDGTGKYWTTSETKNKFIFDGLTTMDPRSKYMNTKFAYQKLRMSSFNYFLSGEAFRVVVKVENTWTQKNLDIIELAVNDAPKAKDLFITQFGTYNNYTMRTIL